MGVPSRDQSLNSPHSHASWAPTSAGRRNSTAHWPELGSSVLVGMGLSSPRRLRSSRLIAQGLPDVLGHVLPQVRAGGTLPEVDQLVRTLDHRGQRRCELTHLVHDHLTSSTGWPRVTPQRSSNASAARSAVEGRCTASRSGRATTTAATLWSETVPLSK